MATYSYTKTLTKAVPTVYTSNNVVLRWDISFTADSTVEGANAFSRDYRYSVDVANGAVLSTYTANSVLALIPEAFDDVFDAHYIAFSNNVAPTPPTTNTMSDFTFS